MRRTMRSPGAASHPDRPQGGPKEAPRRPQGDPREAMVHWWLPPYEVYFVLGTKFLKL